MILAKNRPEMCSKLLEDFIQDSARNLFTITSSFQLLSGSNYVYNNFKILAKNRPEIRSQLDNYSIIELRSDPKRVQNYSIDNN